MRENLMVILFIAATLENRERQKIVENAYGDENKKITRESVNAVLERC